MSCFRQSMLHSTQHVSSSIEPSGSSCPLMPFHVEWVLLPRWCMFLSCCSESRSTLCHIRFARPQKMRHTLLSSNLIPSVDTFTHCIYIILSSMLIIATEPFSTLPPCRPLDLCFFVPRYHAYTVSFSPTRGIVVARPRPRSLSY